MTQDVQATPAKSLQQTSVLEERDATCVSESSPRSTELISISAFNGTTFVPIHQNDMDLAVNAVYGSLVTQEHTLNHNQRSSTIIISETNDNSGNVTHKHTLLIMYMINTN